MVPDKYLALEFGEGGRTVNVGGCWVDPAEIFYLRDLRVNRVTEGPALTVCIVRGEHQFCFTVGPDVADVFLEFWRHYKAVGVMAV